MKKTKSGYSTDVDALEKIKLEHPIIDKILEYRQLVKLDSTYVEGTTYYKPEYVVATVFSDTFDKIKGDLYTDTNGTRVAPNATFNKNATYYVIGYTPLNSLVLTYSQRWSGRFDGFPFGAFLEYPNLLPAFSSALIIDVTLAKNLPVLVSL